MAISAKESPKNHTDKERFAAASSCIATEILTLLFARKRRRSTGPVLYQPPRSRSRRVPDLKVPNNVRSLRRNLENFQVHLLDELNFDFSIIGVSETKIISGKNLDFNPNIPGYIFLIRSDTSSLWRCWLGH